MSQSDCLERPRLALAALWPTLRGEAIDAGERDATLSALLSAAVLRHGGLGEALADRLARKLADADLPAAALGPIARDVFAADPDVEAGAGADLLAVHDRDAASPDLLTPFLWFKGFHALQAHRLAHALWRDGRQHLARHVQSRMSEVFGVDIHPAAVIGHGVLVDHGTGLVIGETAVVGDDVSMLQGVTLGGTGKECGDRHPKVHRGVLIGAGAKVLGNIVVGEGAKIGAGSIVLEEVEPHTTVVGVPARPVGARLTALPGLTMDHSLPEPEYMI